MQGFRKLFSTDQDQPTTCFFKVLLECFHFHCLLFSVRDYFHSTMVELNSYMRDNIGCKIANIFCVVLYKKMIPYSCPMLQSGHNFSQGPDRKKVGPWNTWCKVWGYGFEILRFPDFPVPSGMKQTSSIPFIEEIRPPISWRLDIRQMFHMIMFDLLKLVTRVRSQQDLGKSYKRKWMSHQ